MEEQAIPINFEEFKFEVSVFISKALRVPLIKKKSQKWVVFLHGIQSSKKLFKDLFKQPFFEDYSILALDFIGFGKSSKRESFSYDISDQAKIVEKIIRKLDIKEVHIIGHSLGGMVATLLLKPLLGIIKSFVNAEGNLVYADCGASRIVAEQSFEDFRKKGYEKLKADIKSFNEPSSKQRIKWLEEIPDFAFYKTSVSIVDWSKSEKLLKLFKEAPIRKLFLYGDKNKQKTSVLPNDIEKAEIPNAGHFMLVDNPKVSFEAIHAFLTSIEI